MSDLGVFFVRAGFLVILGLFVLSIISIIRADLFSERVLSKVVEKNLPTSVSSPTTGLTSVGNFSTAPGSATIVSAISETPQTLVVIDGLLQWLAMVLDRREIRIGRAPNNEFVIEDDYASSQHARLQKTDEGWLLQDLNSTNGTYVDGARIGAPVSIKQEMQIRIGKTIFELRG